MTAGKCDHCGADLPNERTYANRPATRYCSTQCRQAARFTATDTREGGGEETTRSPTNRWALICITCSNREDGPRVLSVAHPTGFKGWLYPHPDHATHQLITVDPDGNRAEVPPPEALLAAIAADSATPPPIKHGTEYGWQEEHRRGLERCAACREAHRVAAAGRAAANQRKNAQKRRKAAAAARKTSAA